MSEFAAFVDEGSGRETARNAMDSHLLVKFFTQPHPDEAETEKQGRPVFKDVEFIEIRTPGNKDEVRCHKVTDIDRHRFPEHYRKFKSRQEGEQVVEGTLLSEWPGVTRKQVEELRFFNVLTVEQLANMSDSNAQGFMGINVLRDKAKAYLEASTTQAAANELLELRKQNELLQKQLQELADKVDSEAPKRGRPRKTEE